jgi:hypothetical protein
MMGAIRYFGVAIILITALIGAISGARLEKKRLRVLDAWIALISHIRLQIDCYLMPLDRILATADRALLANIGNERAQTADALLKASLPYLDTDVAQQLSAFFATLGSTYREEELKCCDYYLARLRTHREAVATSLPARVKAKITLTLCVAVGSVILLW